MLSLEYGAFCGVAFIARGTLRYSRLYPFRYPITPES